MELWICPYSLFDNSIDNEKWMCITYDLILSQTIIGAQDLRLEKSLIQEFMPVHSNSNLTKGKVQGWLKILLNGWLKYN